MENFNLQMTMEIIAIASAAAAAGASHGDAAVAFGMGFSRGKNGLFFDHLIGDNPAFDAGYAAGQEFNRITMMVPKCFNENGYPVK